MVIFAENIPYCFNRLVNEGVVRSLEINCATDYHGIESLKSHQLRFFNCSCLNSKFNSVINYLSYICVNYVSNIRINYKVTCNVYFELFNLLVDQKQRTDISVT